MPAGAKVPDSTAIVLYHFNDVCLAGGIRRSALTEVASLGASKVNVS